MNKYSCDQWQHKQLLFFSSQDIIIKLKMIDKAQILVIGHNYLMVEIFI